MEPLLVCLVQSLSVSQGAIEVSRDGWLWGWSGICRLQCLIVWCLYGGCWRSLPVCGLPGGWLIKLGTKSLEAGLSTWGLLVTTSWSPLCIRDPFRSWVMVWFVAREGFVAYRAQLMEWGFEQPTCRRLAFWPASEADVGGGRGQGFSLVPMV